MHAQVGLTFNYAKIMEHHKELDVLVHVYAKQGIKVVIVKWQLLVQLVKMDNPVLTKEQQ